MKLTLAALLALAATRGLATGGSEGHGADLGGPVAWFTGSTRPVSYCLEASPGFLRLQPIERFQNQFEHAWETWVKYLDDKKVEAHVPIHIVQFRRRLEWRPNCNEVELKVRFGGADPSGHPADPSGSAGLAIPGRPATIWLAEPGTRTFTLGSTSHPIDWTEDGLLARVLLHEVGHAFGCGHVLGTIMEEHYVRVYLTEYIAKHRQRALSIDGSRELFICEHCQSEAFDGGLGWEDDEDGKQVFESLAGVPAVGPIQAALILERRDRSTLLFRDSVKPVALALDVVWDAGSFFRGEDVFVQNWIGTVTVAKQHMAWTYMGTLTVGERRLPVTLERNMAASQLGRTSYPLSLYEIRQGTRPPDSPKRLLFHVRAP